MGFIKRLGSLKLTLFLLLVLAVISGIGTLIIQGEAEDFYQQRYGSGAGRLMVILKFSNLYNSFFYNSLLILLGLNLCACITNSFKLILLKKRKSLALFLLHVSILLIFVGGAISKIKKFSEHKQLLPDERVVLAKENAEIVFKKFYIEFYPGTDRPRDFRSEVELFEDGRFKRKSTIRVNHPLRFKGFSFYQSSFEAFADVDLAIEHANKVIWEGKLRQGESLNIPGRDDLKVEISHFMPDFFINSDGQIASKSHKLNNPGLLLSILKDNELTHEEWVFLDKEMDGRHKHKMSIFNFRIKRLDIFYATVLQVVRDPGLVFIWAGFLVLLLGMFLLLFKKTF